MCRARQLQYSNFASFSLYCAQKLYFNIDLKKKNHTQFPLFLLNCRNNKYNFYMFNVPILTVPYASFLVSHPGFGFEHYRHYRLKQIRAEPALPAQTDSSRTGITGSNRFEQNSLKIHIHGYIQACSASFQEWVSLSMMNVFLVLLLIKVPFFPKISFPSYDECFLILLILHMYFPRMNIPLWWIFS